jgi:HK97 family phage prohead protease
MTTFTREVAVDVAEGDGRTLVARVVPYNEVATVNDGQGPYRETFLPGAFDAQERAANRIKAFLVNFRHQRGLQDQVGHAAKIEDRADGLYSELRIFDGPIGDHALSLVNAGVLNRLSVEFVAVKDRVANGVTERVKARLIGVALVPQGANAYGGAEVLAVREGDEDDDEPPVEEPAPARRSIEPIPELPVEMLEAVGIDTTKGRRPVADNGGDE